MRRPPNRKFARYCPLYKELITLKSENRRLRTLASTDPMTGLHNYRFFVSFLAQEIERAKRTKTPVSLIILDIDFFKNINDTYGHPVGDNVLRHVAQTVKNCVRTTDIVCRYGGEEFAVILPGTDIVSAIAVAERIRRTVESSAISVGKDQIKVTISLGVTSFDGTSNESVNSLVSKADQCLLEAKKNGKNIVVTDQAVEDTQVSAEERSFLLSLLKGDQGDEKNSPNPS